MFKNILFIILLLSIFLSGCNNVEFAWNETEHTGGYKLCLGPISRGLMTSRDKFIYDKEIDVKNVITYTVSDFESFFTTNQIVYVSVIAYNNIGDYGPYSNEVSINKNELQ